MSREPVIGLEVHIKLNSPNKLFCKCKNTQEFDKTLPNTHVCPTCMGQPWGLPQVNIEPVKKWILLGLALGCKINHKSLFDRKSYFYPDLPMGYQITQEKQPLNVEGVVEFWTDNFTRKKKVRIKNAHLEADAGKMIHEGGKAYIDYNRSGTPLVEIVTYPDFHSAEEVVDFLKELQRRVKYNDIGYADLEKGQMRVDVNISVRRVEATEGSPATNGSGKVWREKVWEREQKLNTRVEVKNMNSFGAIKRAIEYEFKRQVELLESWGEVEQETRWWDDMAWESYVMRSKENALDYRYFPDPDLPPLVVEQSLIDEVAKDLKKSWTQRIDEMLERGFNKEYINAILSNFEITEVFEQLVDEGFDPKFVAKWIMNAIIRFMKQNQTTELPFDLEDFKEVLRLLDASKLLESQAKIVFLEMANTGKKPQQIIQEKGFEPVDQQQILGWIKEVLQANPQAVEQLKQWDQKVIGFLIGQVMKLSQGKADPKLVRELILKQI